MLGSDEPVVSIDLYQRFHAHSLDLNQDILWQTSDLDTAASRLGLAKVLCVDLVDGSKVLHVLDEDGSLEDVRGGRVGRLENGRDVAEDLVLGLDSGCFGCRRRDIRSAPQHRPGQFPWSWGRGG